MGKERNNAKAQTWKKQLRSIRDWTWLHETQLASCRNQIDDTDQQIVALLNQRARIVAEVGKIKQEAHLPVTVPAREQQILDHIVQLGGACPLPPDRLRRIYQTVLEEMRSWEEDLSRPSDSKSAK